MLLYLGIHVFCTLGYLVLYHRIHLAIYIVVPCVTCCCSLEYIMLCNGLHVIVPWDTYWCAKGYGIHVAVLWNTWYCIFGILGRHDIFRKHVVVLCDRYCSTLEYVGVLYLGIHVVVTWDTCCCNLRNMLFYHGIH